MESAKMRGSADAAAPAGATAASPSSAAPSPVSSNASLRASAGSASTTPSPSRGVKRSRPDDSGEHPQKSRRSQDQAQALQHPQQQTPSPHAREMSDESLRISNEMLRTENAALQARVAAVEALLAPQKQRVRNLEEDLTRIYRRQKKDAEARQLEHARAVGAMREQLERVMMQGEDRPALDAADLAAAKRTLAPEATREMDAFVATCVQWQSRLTGMTAQLATQVDRVERDQVRAAMEDMVTKVTLSHEQIELHAAQEQLQMQRELMAQREHESKRLVAKLHAEREDRECFEALERTVLEERVTELEKKLQDAAQNEIVLMREMSGLREELVKVRSGNHVLPQQEWQQRLHEEAEMKEQLEALTVQCEAQTVQLTLLREDLASLQTENDNAVAELSARKAADGDSNVLTQQLEARIADLSEQLKTKQRDADALAKSKHEELMAAHAKNIESLQNRVEVLTMNIAAKAKVIEDLTEDKTELQQSVFAKEHEAELIQSEKADLQVQLEAKIFVIEEIRTEQQDLQDQLAEKIQVIDELRVDLRDVEDKLVATNRIAEIANAEKLALENRMSSKSDDWVEVNQQLQSLRQELEDQKDHICQLLKEKRSLEQQNEELCREQEAWLLRQPEITELEQKNKELMDQHQERIHHEVRISEESANIERENQTLRREVADLKAATSGRPHESDTADVSPETVNTDERIVKLLVEKQAIQEFLRCYFDKAESKCRFLMDQVANLEADQAAQRQRARESCDLLRMCTQVDSCDGVIRASIVDAMTALEGMS